ncbi:MAG: protein phosphatase CheZ [Pseudomonadota bacterium]
MNQTNGAAGAAGSFNAVPPVVLRPAAFSGQAEILAAIAALREELFNRSGDSDTGAAMAMVTDKMLQTHSRDIEDAKKLKAEIDSLSSAIDTTKREIASMRYKDANRYERITDVTHELDEVVFDTERATENILSSCEEIERHIDQIELQASSPDERAEIQALGQKVVKIYEACNFQDITGQRITKVVNTLKFIEQRLDVMMSIWGGREEFDSIELPEAEVAHEDDLLLNGPAREGGDSVSQADIDALFD